MPSAEAGPSSTPGPPSPAPSAGPAPGPELQAEQVIGKPVYSGVGWAAFSPDGTRFARYNFSGNTGEPQTLKSILDVYDFDRCAGLLSNHRQMVLDSGVAYPGGVAFSSNSRYLYVSKWQTIVQLDSGH